MTPLDRPTAHRAGPAGDVLATFEDAPVLLAECAGPELRIVTANRLFRSLFGDPDGRLIGRAFAEVATDVGGRLAATALAEVYRTGVAVTDVEWRFPADRGPDGRRHPRHLGFSALPVHHPDGALRGVLVTGVDVAADARSGEPIGPPGAGPERPTVLTLHQHILPAALPVPSGARLGAHHVVADADHGGGGDWFEAMTLPDGRIALAVGDVAGHGPAAAAAMSRLRAVLQDALLGGATIEQAVARLDAFAALAPATRAATVALAVLHPATGVLLHLSAGHPPPLVCAPGLRSRMLDRASGGPLGVRAGPPTVSTTTVEPGGVVLLYSDGLLERAGRAHSEGLRELAGVAASAVLQHAAGGPATVPDRVCATVVERMTRAGRHDDVTVLAAHVLPLPTPTWEISIGAPSALSDLRAGFARWLDDLGVTRQEARALALAVAEVATVALGHGLRPAVVDVWADLDDRGTVHVSVTGRGRWTSGEAGASGTDGLGPARAVVDELDVVAAETGSTVTLRHGVHHDTAVGPGAPAAHGARSPGPAPPRTQGLPHSPR